MKIEIHIDNIEIQDIIDTLKDQGVDVTRAEVESHIEEYIIGAVEDSRHERMETVVDSLLDIQDWFLYTERMKNNEHRINGAINTGVSIRAGEHEYEEGHPEVIEISFQGYNCNYIQVIDMKTAKELKDQLDFIL